MLDCSTGMLRSVLIDLEFLVNCGGCIIGGFGIWIFAVLLGRLWGCVVGLVWSTLGW